MIPIFELKRQYLELKNEITHAVGIVMEQGSFTLGPQVRGFEQEFADYLDIYHAVGVASGTDALTLSLKALNIGPGDEVMLPANTYPTAFGIALSGCKIILVDCDMSGNISLAEIEKRLTKKTKVIVPVHLYGNPADVIGIRILLNKSHLDIHILEDAAQAHGAEIRDGSKWRKAGTLGDIGIFSFYPSKNLGAFGDGGMVVTDRSGYTKKLTMLRMYGETSRYHSEIISGVSRLDELQAAILRVKLRHLDAWNEKRAAIAEYYERELAGVGDIRTISNIKFQISNLHPKSQKYTNSSLFETKSCHHLFVIRTKKREGLQKYLLNHEVGCAVHYPVSVHLTVSFKYLGYKKGDFPEAESQAEDVLSLPIYPELKHSEAEQVVRTIKHFFGKI
jgi:dTDP-4-amino-4,6-dideoxygalactose transaminase